MSEKIPRCPFCGEIVYVTGGGTARCLTEGCPMQEAEVKLFIEQWNHRPREERLVKVISDYISTCGCAACSSNKTGKHPERCEDCEIPAFEAALKEEPCPGGESC